MCQELRIHKKFAIMPLIKTFTDLNPQKTMVCSKEAMGKNKKEQEALLAKRHW
jgi:hypothetical protein